MLWNILVLEAKRETQKLRGADGEGLVFRMHLLQIFLLFSFTSKQGLLVWVATHIELLSLCCPLYRTAAVNRVWTSCTHFSVCCSPHYTGD